MNLLWDNLILMYVTNKGSDQPANLCSLIKALLFFPEKRNKLASSLYALFVWFDSLHPSQQSFIYVGQVFLGWTSTKQGLMCLAQGHNKVTPVRLKPAAPSVSSQALYHWATALHAPGKISVF